MGNDNAYDGVLLMTGCLAMRELHWLSLANVLRLANFLLFVLFTCAANNTWASSPIAWKTALTGGANFLSSFDACDAAWLTQDKTHVCPSDGNYCWTSGGPNATNEACTDVCSGACGSLSFCTSSAANCGYGATLIAICQLGFFYDSKLKQCIDLAKTKANGPPLKCDGSVPGSNNPITYGSGNKWVIDMDFNASYIHFSRTFNSNQGLASALGIGWQFAYWQQLGFGEGLIWTNRPDGKALKFVVSGATYTPDADIADRLSGGTDAGGALTGYRFQTAQGVAERYDTAGRLVSLTDTEGRTQTLTYDTQNRLATVTAFWGSKGYQACMQRAGDYLGQCMKACDGK